MIDSQCGSMFVKVLICYKSVSFLSIMTIPITNPIVTSKATTLPLSAAINPHITADIVNALTITFYLLL